MCGRYGFAPPNKEVFATYYGVENKDINFPSSYNISPFSFNPVVVLDDGKKKAVLMRWGFIPHWWQKNENETPFTSINARIEEINDKPFFRDSFQKKRCIIPASFYFEWKTISETNSKQPYLFKLKDRDVFSFAGVYDSWTSKDGHSLLTYAIITKEANKKVSFIHDRMPVVLKKENEGMWLDNSNFDLEKLQKVAQEQTDNEIIFYPVARSVGNPKNNTEDLTKEILVG